MGNSDMKEFAEAKEMSAIIGTIEFQLKRMDLETLRKFNEFMCEWIVKEYKEQLNNKQQ